MELRHLRTFLVAAEEPSFTRAAAVLNVTQAAVSQHIAALERELDVRLFDRGGRRVQLTDHGQRLHRYARKILELTEEAVQAVGQSKRPVQGTLRVAASTVPAEWLLPGLLAEFRNRHPDVRESLTVTDSLGATRAVESGQADVGFVGEYPTSERLVARSIASDELVLVVSPQHAWATGGTATLRQLRHQPLVSREPGSGTRSCIEAELRKRGLDPAELQIVMEVNSNDAIRAAVEQGVGVAFLSTRAASNDIAQGRIVPVNVRGLRPRRQLYLITRQEQPQSSLLLAFLAFVEKS